MTKHLTKDQEIAALKARILDQEQELAARDAQLAAQADQIRKLEHNVEVFRRIAFGRGSEKRGHRKLAPHESGMRQQHLWLTQLVEVADRAAERTAAHGTIELSAPRTQRKPSARRQKLPSHLPRMRTTY